MCSEPGSNQLGRLQCARPGVRSGFGLAVASGADPIKRSSSRSGSLVLRLALSLLAWVGNCSVGTRPPAGKRDSELASGLGRAIVARIARIRVRGQPPPGRGRTGPSRGGAGGSGWDAVRVVRATRDQLGLAWSAEADPFSWQVVCWDSRDAAVARLKLSGSHRRATFAGLARLQQPFTIAVSGLAHDGSVLWQGGLADLYLRPDRPAGREGASDRKGTRGQPGTAGQGRRGAGVTEAAEKGRAARQDGQDEEAQAEEKDRARQVAACGCREFRSQSSPSSARPSFTSILYLRPFFGFTRACEYQIAPNLTSGHGSVCGPRLWSRVDAEARWACCGRMGGRGRSSTGRQATSTRLKQTIAASLCGDGVVLVEQTAELVATPDLAWWRRLGWRRFGERRTLVERAVRTVLVVVADVGAYGLLEVAAAEDQDPVEAFASQASHPRSACAFARGARTGVRMTRMPSERNTSSKLGVNLLSRSRTRKHSGCSRSASVITRLRACWVTQRSCGFAVTPPRCTRRLASSMKKSTYSRRSQTVSTVRKSQATIADACARRNSDQLSSARRGAGPIPCRRRSVWGKETRFGRETPYW
jgi:hypothetical protein